MHPSIHVLFRLSVLHNMRGTNPSRYRIVGKLEEAMQKAEALVIDLCASTNLGLCLGIMIWYRTTVEGMEGGGSAAGKQLS